MPPAVQKGLTCCTGQVEVILLKKKCILFGFFFWGGGGLGFYASSRKSFRGEGAFGGYRRDEFVVHQSFEIRDLMKRVANLMIRHFQLVPSNRQGILFTMSDTLMFANVRGSFK